MTLLLLPVVFHSSLSCNFFLYVWFFKKIYLFMAVLGLRFFVRAFSSCGKWGPVFITVRGPLSQPRLLQSTGSRRASSVIVAHGPSCSAACGIFPDQGSNPCPVHWQADSQPLHHQGSPVWLFLTVCWNLYLKNCRNNLRPRIVLYSSRETLILQEN